MTHVWQTGKQEQQLYINFAMRHAFAVLQMPLNELTEWLYRELEQNPVLNVTLPNLSSDLSWIQKEDSLYEYLEKEISLYFDEPHQREIARFIAGSLDSKGFLTLSHKEICKRFGIELATLKNVLTLFHQIEPVGMGAQNTQEALLLQLMYQGKEKTCLYQIISKHYNDLLHNRLQVIAKSINISIQNLKKLINKDLRRLNPFPAHRFTQQPNYGITSDLRIDKQDDFWKVEVCEDTLPQFHIHPHYIERFKQEKITKEERHFILRHLASGNWLVRILNRRKKILMDIGSHILKQQKNFLEGIEDTPLPLTRKSMAKALDLSESTVTRAIYQKYVTTPRGILPLNAFFTYTIQTEKGTISNQKAKNLIVKLIQSENKHNPLSDQALSDQLCAQGIPCARRTIAKYRRELKISSRHHRKEWT